jgi:hypothetical protein
VVSGVRKLLNVAGHDVEAVNEFEPDRLFSYFIKNKFGDKTVVDVYEINDPQAFH